MARPMHRLDARTVKAAAEKDQQLTLADGGGLYFFRRPPNGTSWLYRWKRNGRDRWAGLGSYPTITLADARERAAEARRKVAFGGDPIAERREERTAAVVEAAKAVSFEACATSYIAAHRAGWGNEKHADQWTSTLRAYAYPIIGALPVADVDTALVLRCLEPIWTTKPETAKRVRGRIEKVLDFAKVRGFRDGDNPARWRGHLQLALAPKGKVRAVKHHEALPYAELPGFMALLRSKDSTSARALELLILTASRTGEIIGATWGEIDLGERVWTIPAERMKAAREHRVPLPDSAVALLVALGPGAPDAFLFPGGKLGKGLSNMAMSELLKGMVGGRATVHGFRSTFSDWTAERTAYPADVREMALAHTIGNRVEAAYRRGDLFDKRRALMQDWSDYCGSSATGHGTTAPMREAVA